MFPTKTRIVLRIRTAAFFFCGVYACICDLLPIPKVVSVACLLPAVYTLCCTEFRRPFCLASRRFLSWYGLFALFVCLSAIWSPNSINFSPDDTVNTVFVYKRMFNALILTVIFIQLRPTASELVVGLKGLLLGCVLGCLVVLINENGLIGYTRLGTISYGAGPTFGNVAVIGVALSMFFLYENNSSKIYAILLLFQLFAVALSGSRQAILCALLYILLISFFKNRVSLWGCLKYSVIAIALLAIVLIALMKIDFLYNAIGFRIEDLLAGHDGSNIERKIMRDYAIKIFFDNPIIGVGIHGFAVLFGRFYGWSVWSHCGFTEILSCYGLVGFFLFYRYFWNGIKKSIKELNRNRLFGSLFLAFVINTLLFDAFFVIFLDVRSIFLMGVILKPYVSEAVAYEKC